MTRALILVRLSRVTDATTSPERQRKDCERFCSALGWTVAGVTEDMDVSGSTDPLKRSGSGPWLRDRLDEFDVVVAQKLDRFGRSTDHVHGLFKYLDKRGKALHTADGQINTGAGGPGELILFILSWAAKNELHAIRARTGSSAEYLIKDGAYRGSLAPVGYRAVKDGKRWRLVPDECGHASCVDQRPVCTDAGLAPVVREIVRKVLAGGRLSAIVADLNRRGVPTQRDRQDALKGREPKGRGWTVSNLRRLLTSPTLVGQAVHRPVELDESGQRVRDEEDKLTYGPEQLVLGEDSLPIQRAVPLVSHEDYESLQAVLAERRENEPKQRRRADTTLLVGVIHCGGRCQHKRQDQGCPDGCSGICGRPMFRLKGGPGRKPRYRCSSTQYGQSCGTPSVMIETADGLMTEYLMDTLGGLPHVEKRLVPGTDHAAELADIQRKLSSLGQAVTRFPPGEALDNLLSQVDTLSIRKRELEAQPTRPTGYEYVPTGLTFAEFWDSLDDAGRNDYLRNNKVRLNAVGGPAPEWHFITLFMDDMIRAVNPEMAERITGPAEFDAVLASITGSAL